MLVLLLTTALVVATATLVSTRIADGGVTQWLVGAYVLAFTEVVVLSLALSVGSNLNRLNFVVATAVFFVIAVFSLRSARIPPVRAAAKRAVAASCDATVLVVAAVAVGVVAYSIALA